MMRLNLTVPHRLYVWFRSAVPPDATVNQHLCTLIHRCGRHPERAVYPVKHSPDDEPHPLHLRMDDETADILRTAADQLCMDRTEYCRYLMRHAGLSVCVGLDADTMARLTELSGGDVDGYVKNLITEHVKRDTDG